ncbi:hypothetical protein K439DRAFT_139088 [Ramaria rubella]|nr:hypothetical protein K439DRAFT_139088 [Ramaria rubella]
MLSSTLSRAFGGFGLHTLQSFQSATLVTRRGLFYPNPPPMTLESTTNLEFPPQSRAHITKEQFNTVRNVDGLSRFSSEAFTDLIDETHDRSRDMAMVGMTPEERWSNKATPHAVETPNIHAGRTVVLFNQEPVSRAYARLQSILRQNNIKRELKLAERHEKKGAKRRRLRSERWKRKFSDEVRKKVQLVTEIRLRDRMWGARH